MAVIDRWCWDARTSVGASSAAWPPESIAASMARRATMVLPEPTSPWRSRCMGRSRASSAVEELADVTLAAGELERQACVEGREQAARSWRSRRAQLGLGGLAALGEDRLEHERLIVLEPVEASVGAGRQQRAMHELERLASTEEVRAPRGPPAAGARGCVRRVERVVHEPAQPERVQLARRRVDRHPVGAVGLHAASSESFSSMSS